MKFRTSAVAIFAVAGLVAACGGSNNTGMQTATKASSVSLATAATPSAAATTTTSPGPTPASSFASAQNCQQLVDLGAKYLRDVSLAGNSGSVDLAAVVKADQGLADAAPSAIHSDAGLVVHVFSSYVATLAKVGYTPGTTPNAAQIAGIGTYVQQFSQPQFQAAMQRLSVWVHHNCRGVTP